MVMVPRAVLAPWTTATWLPLFLTTVDGLFLASLPSYLGGLYRASIKVRPSWHGRLKVFGCLVHAVVQLLVLVLQLTRGNPSSQGIAESALSLAASLGLLLLSPLAHKRSLRPSNVITAYLLARLLCCLLWLPSPEPSLGGTDRAVIAAQMLSTLLLLLLEMHSKGAVLLQAYAYQPPEATTSFLGNWVFLWINPVLRNGYTKILDGNEIPILEESMSSKSLRLKIRTAWNARARPENGATLPRALLACLLSPFLAAVIPRIFVILFRFAQPLLMSQAIRFVTSPYTQADDGETGYWIVVEAVVVYTGIATSTSVYRHRLNRLEVMIRGALVGLLHEHALQTRGSNEDDGKAVTLVSNDMGNIQNSGEVFHETWGQFVEVIVGTTLLATRVGWLWPLPLVLIFLCSRMSRYVAKTLKPAQSKWNKATQQRISVINSMLGSIKNIKMLGLQQSVANHVENLRDQELRAAAGVRWLSVAYNASANALGMFTPVLTIVVYAGLAYSRGVALDIETAFTSIAILALITHPANMVMTMVPRAVISYSSFERMQTYLLDERPVHSPFVPKDFPSYPPDGIAINLEDVDVTNHVTSKLILRDISVEVPHSSIVILTGPVGSGKTIFIRAILGDLAISSGSVQISPGTIAYCSQSAWLPNDSVRKVICGPTVDEEWDEAWYQKSVQACCLDSDLEALPDGDFTVVGSKGMNLSGGQRQRVALARAVYSRAKIVLLDDSFSALDGKTQSQVIENLLGPEGVWRKLCTTVVWCTTATRFFQLADEVIVLLDGTIQEKGTWNRLRKDDPLLDGMLHSYGKAPDDAARTAKGMQSRLAAKDAGDGVTGDLARKNGDLSLYSYYCRAAGLVNIATYSLCAMFYGFFITFPPYWLKWWTEPPQSSSHTGIYMAGYIVLLLLAYTITIYGIYITQLHIAPTSGLIFHHRLLTAVVSAPLLYFSEASTGIILNRFSEDIQLVDKALADAWATINIQVFKLLVQACLIFASQPLMTFSLPFSVVTVYIVQKVYLRTSRQLRILELESRAAVISSFLETVQGATTIRAFGWDGSIARENIATLDSSQRPFYLLLCLRRWLNVVLDLLIAGIAVGTIWLAVLFRGSTTGGQVGVALNIILVANSTLLKLVESWTNLEISLGAVARLKEVDTTTPSEEEQHHQLGHAYHQDHSELPPHWPSTGAIEFKNVKAAYNPHTPVLQNISLTIKPGQTVVICGRTGSGKSSLLLALLRLLDLTEGSIAIDGVNISSSSSTVFSLSKALLRERVFITVAQEAFFLPQASLQFNLDPELKAAPSMIVSALSRTGLWEKFSIHRVSLPPLVTKVVRVEGECEPLLPSHHHHHHHHHPRQDGSDEGSDEEARLLLLLSTPLEDLPALSSGQTQLLALTRALVRKYVLATTATTINNKLLPTSSYATFPNDNHSENTPSPLYAYDADNSHATTKKPVILLDEVTSSLDPVTEAKIYDVLEHEFVAEGHTVVMVTHKVQGIRGRLRRGRDAIVWMAGGWITAVETF